MNDFIPTEDQMRDAEWVFRRRLGLSRTKSMRREVGRVFEEPRFQEIIRQIREAEWNAALDAVRPADGGEITEQDVWRAMGENPHRAGE